MRLFPDRYTFFLTASLSLAALSLSRYGRNDRSASYGNFKATEIVVSSEASGKLIRYDVDEGLRFTKGQVVAVVDTTQLALDRKQLRAQLKALLEQRNPRLSPKPTFIASSARTSSAISTATRGCSKRALCRSRPSKTFRIRPV